MRFSIIRSQARLFTILLVFSPLASANNKTLNADLLDLPANTWVTLHSSDKSLRREAHAGVVYDSRRGTILMFGSNTHGNSDNNSVLEFDPANPGWVRHQPASDPATYRINAQGFAVAGEVGAPMPIPMHTYDAMVYDPTGDALVVFSHPNHNTTVGQYLPRPLETVTWIYQLANRRWEIFDNQGDPQPTFFAQGATYDPDRDTIIAFRNRELWELGPDRKVWQLAHQGQVWGIHHTMVYDQRHRKAVLFGRYRGTNEVLVYTPDPVPGQPGSFELRQPGGDPVPPDQHLPAAYDPELGVFLLVVDDGDEAISVVYDLASNRYTRLPGAGLPAQGMNYMMVYDPRHRVFLLITGGYRIRLTVQALRLAELEESLIFSHAFE